jgi:hypothetical protein
MDSNGNCKISTATILALVFGNAVMTFRMNSMQGFFFMIDKFELYQYQDINFTGIIVKIFDQLNFFQNNQWSFLPFNIN